MRNVKHLLGALMVFSTTSALAFNDSPFGGFGVDRQSGYIGFSSASSFSDSYFRQRTSSDNNAYRAGFGQSVVQTPGQAAVNALTASIFDINFDFSRDSNGFFSHATLGATRTSLLNAAGAYFESIIIDELTAIDSDGDVGGVNNFTASFFHPGTGATENISNFDVAANTITVFVGGRLLAGSTLGQGGPGGFGVSGTPTFVDNAVNRGETGVGTTDFAPWGGSLTFDSDATWYYDPDPSDSTTPGLTGGLSDFYSVALHELGHVLGVGTAGSWFADIDSSTGLYTGSAVTTANGGTSPGVYLPDGGAHFAEGTMGTVDGTPQEVAMDPTITTGTQKKFTNIDVAALQDIGWEVSPN